MSITNNIKHDFSNSLIVIGMLSKGLIKEADILLRAPESSMDKTEIERQVEIFKNSLQRLADETIILKKIAQHVNFDNEGCANE